MEYNKIYKNENIINIIIIMTLLKNTSISFSILKTKNLQYIEDFYPKMPTKLVKKHKQILQTIIETNEILKKEKLLKPYPQI
jgi:uncharacterized protein with gpF-like domain